MVTGSQLVETEKEILQAVGSQTLASEKWEPRMVYEMVRRG